MTSAQKISENVGTIWDSPFHDFDVDQFIIRGTVSKIPDNGLAQTDTTYNLLATCHENAGFTIVPLNTTTTLAAFPIVNGSGYMVEFNITAYITAGGSINTVYCQNQLNRVQTTNLGVTTVTSGYANSFSGTVGQISPLVSTGAGVILIQLQTGATASANVNWDYKIRRIRT